MLVDYVRVYKSMTVPGPTMTAGSINVTAGQTGTSTLNLTSTAGAGKVYLTCSNAPSNSTCSISPNVVDFSNSASATATVSLATQAHTASLRRNHTHMWAFLAFGGVFFGLWLLPGIRRQRAGMLLGVIVLLLPILAVNACGSGGSSTSTPPPPTLGGTPSGSYTMTVTSYTVSGDQSTASVAVTVN